MNAYVIATINVYLLFTRKALSDEGFYVNLDRCSQYLHIQ